jgi:hypothetical protein
MNARESRSVSPKGAEKKERVSRNVALAARGEHPSKLFAHTGATFEAINAENIYGRFFHKSSQFRLFENDRLRDESMAPIYIRQGSLANLGP